MNSVSDRQLTDDDRKRDLPVSIHVVVNVVISAPTHLLL